MLVQEFLQLSAARLPNKAALICKEQRLTYAQIEGMANRLAQALQLHGVQRGDRVGIYLENSAEAVVSIFGVLKAGGVFVVINRSMKPEKLTYILNNCQAKAVILDDQAAGEDLITHLQTAIKTLCCTIITGDKAAEVITGQSGCISFNAVQREFSTKCPAQVNSESDLACLIYTSGSTGEPKGVMSDHSNVVFAAGSITQYLENREDDIVINVLPLSFDYGLYQLLMVFKFGGTLVLENSFAYPALILKRMEEEKATGLPGVPTIFSLLLQMDLSRYNLSKLRYITNTAAALPPSHIEQLRKKFSWARLYSMYGLTETKRTLYLPPEELEKRLGSVGKAIPGTEVWLEDEAGRRLGPGQIGELVVRGPHVMRGYWAAPEATAKRFRPGPIPGERLCYTGDLFRMDAGGFLYFVGRQDDIIKSRGEKVSPKEVENVLYALKGVVEAAVIGVPDPVYGQAVKAIIVPNGAPLTAPMVLAHCRAHLEDVMVPRYVEFRRALPKTSSGKIKKTELV